MRLVMDSVDEIWRKSNYFYQFMSLACYVACFLQPHTRWLQNEIEKRLLRSGVFYELVACDGKFSTFEKFFLWALPVKNLHVHQRTLHKKNKSEEKGNSFVLIVERDIRLFSNANYSWHKFASCDYMHSFHLCDFFACAFGGKWGRISKKIQTIFTVSFEQFSPDTLYCQRVSSLLLSAWYILTLTHFSLPDKLTQVFLFFAYAVYKVNRWCINLRLAVH